jgi:hypothetical protein
MRRRDRQFIRRPRMQCPKCRTQLEEFNVQQGNTTVGACADCKGVWFDGGELEAVLTEAFTEVVVPRSAARTTYVCSWWTCAEPAAGCGSTRER